MLAFAPHLRARLHNPVIITGAGGWLGRAALEMAAAAGVDIHAFGATARRQRLRNGQEIDIAPLTALPACTARNALIFHTAFLTREHAGGAGYIATNRALSETVAHFIRQRGAAGILLPSSGAARHGTLADNPYGALKREDEERFANANIPAAIIRVFNLAGPFINKLDSYALACILRDLLANRPVSLRAAHPVWRGYTHVQDLLNIGLATLLQGGAPMFDSWGEPIELSALAARAAAQLGRPLILHRPAWEHAPPDLYLGQAQPYQDEAARAGLTLSSLDSQIRDTAAFLR